MIRRTTKAQQGILLREKSYDQHIPSVLIDEMESLRNVLHRTDLADFADNYRNKRFTKISEEYEFIKREIIGLFGTSFSKDFADLVQNQMRISLATSSLEKIREQFIHPFQVFLLGELMIDRNFARFQEWYSGELCGNRETCVESAWLLTTIFHDLGRGANALRRAYEQLIDAPVKEVPRERYYISRIASIFAHIGGNLRIENWNGKGKSTTLEKVLREYSKRQNHGVNSAVLMLKNLERKFGSISGRDVVAAFAIAVHDRQLHDSLLSHHIFPIRINKFPLTCLLMYCDTVQEWGRSEFEDEPRLIQVEIEGDTVSCQVSFERTRLAGLKLKEIEKIQRCIDSAPLELDFNVRVHVGH